MIGTSKRPARSTMTMSNYDKQPYIQVSENNDDCITGWENICSHLNSQLAQRKPGRTVVVVDCYHGVQHSEVETSLRSGVKHELFIKSTDAFKSEAEIQEMVYPFVTDDRIFGFVTNLEIDAYFDKKKLSAIRQQIDSIPEGIVVVYGEGAACVAQHCDVLIYVDMARWEIQLRMRRNEVANLGVANHKAEFTALYKQAFFVDWRVLDRHKVKLMDRWNFVLDTNKSGQPKLTTGDAILRGLEMASQQPFRVVPFFDPGPWGGQWLKEVADLDRSVVNFAWAFDCVPEENSLLFKFGDVVFELPSINLVLKKPELLLGEKVNKRFGAEFPIRFDFLDTMDGGNLSLQVHPTDEYIKEQFGMSFTQDESYYMMDAKEGAVVYLGLKEDVNPDEMITELENAQQEGGYFDADKHVEKWKIQKHDHLLIPAGTVHCSGKDSVVLEISATPYNFTFKLWDWGRLGLDGKPRPINISHGKKVIDWDRRKSWTEKNLINRTEKVAEGDGWVEERTGLHEFQFIETRRHWFRKKVHHSTNGGVNVLNLVEGREAIVESPENKFAPFIVHYAETFIVPAAVGEYTIRPYGEAEGQKCATLKAFVKS